LIGDIGGCRMETIHIGASGLIFGWLAFLLVFGWLTRHIWWIITSLVVLFVYGGILLGALPVLNRCGGVSWQGHLCGAIAGLLAAYWLSGPEREARAGRKAGRLPGPAA
jgi:membrane associated rhomboid family serine protease